MDRNLLPALAAFAEVVREGSFTRAATRLEVSPSALSQMVRALEAKLAVRLLNRSTRSVSVTQEGRKLFAALDPGLAMVSHAVSALETAGDNPAGEVRINSSRIAANHLILPHIGEFRRRYPQVALEIIIDDGFGDIIREGCDAGIRLRESVSESMIAVPISPPVSLAIVGSPAYFAAFPAPKTPDDLAEHNCLGLRLGFRNVIVPWEFTTPDNGEEISFHPHGSLVINDDEILVNAALQGVGLVMHMDFTIRKYIESGELVRVLADWCPAFDGFNLYLSSREQMPAKLRALVNFLVEKRRALVGLA